MNCEKTIETLQAHLDIAMAALNHILTFEADGTRTDLYAVRAHAENAIREISEDK